MGRRRTPISALAPKRNGAYDRKCHRDGRCRRRLALPGSARFVTGLLSWRGRCGCEWTGWLVGSVLGPPCAVPVTLPAAFPPDLGTSQGLSVVAVVVVWSSAPRFGLIGLCQVAVTIIAALSRTHREMRQPCGTWFGQLAFLPARRCRGHEGLLGHHVAPTSAR